LKALLNAVGCLLDLTQFLTVFKYRFNLLEVTEVSLEEPVATDAEGHALRLGDTISAETATEEVLVVEEVARSLSRNFPLASDRCSWSTRGQTPP